MDSHSTTKEFSFYSHVHLTYSRIDYFFLDRILLPSVKLCEYSAIVISAHAPLLLDLDLLPRGDRQPHWRLNTGLLSLEKFSNFISGKSKLFIQNNNSESDSTSSSLLWETCKAVIRGEVISYSARECKLGKQTR